MASRQEKRRRREERLRLEREAAAAKRRHDFWVQVAAIAIVAPFVVFAAIKFGGPLFTGKGEAGKFASGQAPPQRVSGLPQAVRASGCELLNLPSEGRSHTTKPVQYRSNPPSSGPHNPVPAADEAYTDAPAIEHLVHALEHGRVIVWFAPSLATSERGALKALYDEDSYHMVLSPNETRMPYAVAASAWTRVLGCKRLNPEAFDALRAFKRSFRDRAPESVP